ncbi:N-acylneuraminate cytidylyltransferase [Nymphalis io]|uniref:N-acylneuraminate cytidylyltransferase n=1 Tax=Inachis io TaxID=171585 RepID=UPI0021683A07|nr:N-acylneuraminate cytidylyltransferase [Nymphalis io]
MFVKFLLFVGLASPVLCENTAVLILARGGSKGIRLKNIQNIGGISLLGRTILTAKLAGLQDITVSTDHPLIALEGFKYNVSVLKRSYVTSTDWAPSIWGVSEFMEKVTNFAGAMKPLKLDQ